MGTQPPTPKWAEHHPIFAGSAHVYCGQTAGWMKTPLGTEVHNGPGHTVLDGVPALCERGTAVPLFSAHVYCGHGRPSQLLLSSPRNRHHPPPPPVDEAPSRSQVDEPSTRRRLRCVQPPPLRPLTRRLNAFCSFASTYFCTRSCLLGVAMAATTLKILVALIF